MPLTRDRDGVFRGRRHNSEAWYIVDPQVVGGVDAAVQEWRDCSARTNTSLWRRILHRTLFVVVWLGATVAAVVIGSLAPEMWRGLVYVGGFFAGLILAGVIVIAVMTPRDNELPQSLAVVLIPEHIALWASDSLPAVSLWRLVRTHVDLAEVRNLIEALHDEWGHQFDVPRPDRLINDIIDPLLQNEFVARRAEYLRVCEWIGFRPREDDVAEHSAVHITSAVKDSERLDRRENLIE